MIAGAHKWLRRIAWLPVGRIAATNFLLWPCVCEQFVVTGKGSVIVVVDELGRRWSTSLVCDDDWRQS